MVAMAAYFPMTRVSEQTECCTSITAISIGFICGVKPRGIRHEVPGNAVNTMPSCASATSVESLIAVRVRLAIGPIN